MIVWQFQKTKKNKALNIFTKTLDLYDESCKLFDANEELLSLRNENTESLFAQIDRLEWSRKVKYSILMLFLPRIGIDQFLQSYPDFILKIFSSMK